MNLKWLFTFLLAVTVYTASAADILVVTRPANLRVKPTTASAILQKLSVGDTLDLVIDIETKGYYQAIARSSGKQGWVYANLVKKFTINTSKTNTNEFVDVKVLDVGAGLSTIIMLPNKKYIIYDAGGTPDLSGKRTLAQIQQHIPFGSEIELLILSHTDQDHIAAAGDVINNYKVKKLLWGGYERSMVSSKKPTKAFDRIIQALADHPNTENVNLNQRDSTIVPGNHFNIGQANFTFLCGFGKPQPDWGKLSPSEKLNSVSIVMKLTYAGNSVLFCGDAFGREFNSAPEVVLGTEKFLVEKAAQYLPSTVIIAPHHGASNGSSKTFTQKVNAKYVIFSAGHLHDHPTKRTAELYHLTIPYDHMFRTDRGDDEGEEEWDYLRQPGTVDPYNDDDVRIRLAGDGTCKVEYVNP